MPDKAFLDTNILVYAFSERDHRQATALSLLLSGGAVSIQTLNEFVNVITGKMKTPWLDVLRSLDTVGQLCLPPFPVTLAIHHRGLQIAQATGYHIYDSLMLAAAIEGECTVFYSEDMQDGHVIDTLTIRNPFGRKKIR